MVLIAKKETNKKSLSYNTNNNKTTKEIIFKNDKIKTMISLMGFIIFLTFIFYIFSKLIIKKNISHYKIIIILLLLFLVFSTFIFVKNNIFINLGIINKIQNFIKNKSNNEKESFINKEKYLYITKDSYNHWCLDNSFVIFNSLDNVLYLVYSTENKSIIIFNLI